MKRFLFSCFSCFLITFSAKANHITGGEMYYTFVSQAGNNFTYEVTLKIFRDPSSAAGLDPSMNIAIYDKGTNALTWSGNVALTSQTTLTLTSPGPCIVNPPTVSYNVGFYTFNITLPGSLNGYTIVGARCCRISGITNLTVPSNTFGATYTAEIPGTEPITPAPANNSAKFKGIDTVVICSGYPFTYDFGAIDNDGDSLSYTFCDGYTSTGGTIPNPPAAPPYVPLNYSAPFNGSFPMGPGVSINQLTGEITGVAPAAGIYVVTVCVSEYRNGVKIATQRKDLQVKIADCDIATVTLEPAGYINCNDLTMTFSNLTPSALINTYFWDFGNLATLADTSNLASPTYTYPDTGVYTIKLVANRNMACSDSTTAEVRVFPGFFPDFNFASACLNTPTQFYDLTTALYGSVNFWRWDFGVPALADDTSRLQNPQYTYIATGTYNVEFIVGSTKGCRDTLNTAVTVIDKPPITMAFRDTLICSVDTLRLLASGTGAFTWTPNYNILNATSAAPFVFPKITTWYTVELNDNGCRNRDSVRVRVVDFVTLNVGNDTTVCTNDAAQLTANTNGLQYSWSPPGTLNNTGILNPVATPAVTTTYQITSRIGGCTATGDIRVNVVPYPFVNAGADTTICFNSSARLNGQQGGTSFTWSPGANLSSTTILNPVATPASTIQYILTVTDNVSGCPKPGRDTVVVNVLPEVIANAGRDTIIIAGLPLQLRATGGTSYVWSPATGLSNPNIAGPIALLDGNPEIVTYQVVVRNQAGCADSATITITVFKTGPDIFVPTGFTPNGDGRNDVFRPIYVGMQTIDYFSVYNRWGQLVYSSNLNNGQGWDGTIGGLKQNSGTFIWMVRATDVLGKVHFKKGTVLLIR